MKKEEIVEIVEIVEYLNHHIPIIIKDDKVWCNANIYLENGTLVVKPIYDLLFDGR